MHELRCAPDPHSPPSKIFLKFGAFGTLINHYKTEKTGRKNVSRRSEHLEET
ncbi:Uncharacterized protein pbN1_23780 [Aromatoleum bremense]|nr:Uncharacterized protein pbN1_23780 [Aromatoleum bremense]